MSKTNDENDIVCLCKHISKGEILTAINNGCDSVDAVEAKTGAGSQCGACKKIIEKIILPSKHC